MFSKTARTRARTGLAVLGAAALLVGGADLASYAAGGGGLVLGHGNTATKTTKLKSTGKGATLSLLGKKGPALALKAKKGPAFTVNSSTVISHLNADQVDGKDATSLETTTTRYAVGTPNITSPAPDGQYFQQVTFPAGSYDVSMHAEFYASGGGSASVQCLVLDPTLFANPSNPDYSKLFLLGETDNGTGNTSGIVHDASTMTLAAPTAVDFGCVLSGAVYSFAQPFYFEVHPLSSFAAGQGTPTTIVPKGAASKLLN